ncbi:CBS domain-containing protein [uncultured Paraglaciecola sp.]|uniref:CBS domain-containing protein n=1 Tax=uncultured Paraglaciecola sp. TaxID=1765024 RepID=UPI0030DC7CB5
MLVEKIMSKPVVTVTLDDNLRMVKHLFENAKFHHLMVVEEGKLFGVLSDRDLLRAISPFIGTVQETAHDKFTLNKKVHQIMTRKPISLTPLANVYEAISLFNQHNISCIPIVNDNNVPVGIISWRDILRVIEVNHNKKRNKTP